MGRKRKKGKSKESAPPGRRWMLAAAGFWLLVCLHHSVSGIPWEQALHPFWPSSWRIVPGVVGMHFLRLGGLLWVAAVLTGTGHSLLRRMPVTLSGFWERLAFGFGLGYGLWGTVLLLLGLARLWHRPVFLGLWALGSAASLFEFSRLRKAWRDEGIGEPSGRERGIAGFLTGAVLLWWCLHLPYALIPETFYDAMNYHLAFPNLYLVRHGITPTPEHSFSGIPSLPSMLSALTLAADRSGVMAQLLHMSMVLAVCAALLGGGRRLGSPRAGLGAGFVFALTPVVTSEAYRLSVGLEGALMQTLCFLGFAAAAMEGPGTPGRRGWLFVSGIFLGFCMATKYPAWLLGAALVCGAVYLKAAAFKRGENVPAPLAWKEVLLPLAAALLVLLPWVLKNLAFYGNPVYPFFHDMFVPGAEVMPDWRFFSAGGLDLGRTFGTWAGFKRVLLHLWDFTRQAEEVGSSIGPVYLGLLPLLFLAPLAPRLRLLAVMTAAAWVPLSLTSPITRFFIPSLGIWALLTALALYRLPDCVEKTGLRLGALAAVLAMAGGYFAMGTFTWGDLDVVLGGRSFREFLAVRGNSYHYLAPAFSGFEFLEKETPPDAKVLIFGDSRHFPLWRDRVVSSLDQTPALIRWADDADDAGDLRRRFREEGVTYILVNHGEVFRNLEDIEITRKGKDNFDAFWAKYTLKAHEALQRGDHWVAVYRVLDEAEAAKPHPADDLWKIYSKGGRSGAEGM